MQKKENPFTFSFGKEPSEEIERTEEINDILTTFSSGNPKNHLYLITGVRGSGKTVLMNTIANRLQKTKNWVVVRLNPESQKDLLTTFASKLYNEITNFYDTKSDEISLNLGFLNFKRKFGDQTPSLIQEDSETITTDLAGAIASKHKKILIVIDEVTNNQQIKKFCHSFQSLLGDNVPVFMIMTGLFSNIDKLRNEKTLTFLYRAELVNLPPLNIDLITERFKKIFKMNDTEAIEAANLTKGYSFAYQALGYHLWESEEKKLTNKVIVEYDKELSKFVYEKIWSELTDVDKDFLGFLNSEETKTADLLTSMKIDKSYYSSYADKLEKQGIIYRKTNGKIIFQLPRFFDFVEKTQLKQNMLLENQKVEIVEKYKKIYPGITEKQILFLCALKAMNKDSYLHINKESCNYDDVISDNFDILVPKLKNNKTYYIYDAVFNSEENAVLRKEFEEELNKKIKQGNFFVFENKILYKKSTLEYSLLL